MRGKEWSVLPEHVQVALKTALDLQPTSFALSSVACLPKEGLHTKIGIPYATLLHAVNGRLTAKYACQNIERWYHQTGRFLPSAPHAC